MIALLSLAFAGTEDSTLARIAALEWDRSEPITLQTQLAGGDGATRAAAVRALGRLRSADAVDHLVAWRDDPDPQVRVAVARALGWTPGGATPLRAWWLDRGGEPVDVQVAIAVGIGRSGDARDVHQLASALLERGAVGTAAAQALGILGSRGVVGLDAVVGPLVDRLDTLDGERQDAVAWALSRIRKPVAPADLPKLLRAMDSGSPEARAWLVRAAWTSLPREERDARFLVAMTDAPRLVQIAVLGALEPEDAEVVILAAFLVDSDPWVRYATIDALGRHSGEDRLDYLREHLARTRDADEQARVVRAMRISDPTSAQDASLPPAVRAAWVEALADSKDLVRNAVESPDAVVRTAAVGAWAERDPKLAEIEALLAATDPVVRQVAFDRASALPTKLVAPKLRGPLAAEVDPAARAQGWKTYATLLAADRRVIGPKDKATAKALAALTTPDVVTAGHAAKVAKQLGLPAPAPAAGPTETWTVPVGDGTAQIPARPKDLADVWRIRGARVHTDHGEFVVSLDPERAPLAVATFASLAEAHYFDGLVFHRVVPGFVAQAGCPRGDGWGGPGFVLPDEDSEMPFTAGSLGMAREEARDTGGSQWFVTTSDQPHLTSEYTRFGQVVHGLHVVQGLPQGAVIERVDIERVP